MKDKMITVQHKINTLHVLVHIFSSWTLQLHKFRLSRKTAIISPFIVVLNNNIFTCQFFQKGQL